MKRLDNGEGDSPLISIRLPRKTTELLDALIAALPPHPVGPPPKPMVIRAVIDAGIEAMAILAGIKLVTPPKPINQEIEKIGRNDGIGKAIVSARKSSSKNRAPVEKAVVHPRSRARAEKRAAARLAAGCACKSRHVPPCKLYRATVAS